VRSAELEARIAAREMQLNALRQAGDVLERGAFGNTRGYADYFRAFARQDAPGLWLTGLAIEGAGQDISIDGRATDAGLVPGYISKLSGETVLKGKTFGSLQITAPSAIDPVAAQAGAAARPAVPYVEFSLQAQAGNGG
jgi:Tfp pilus assembly protein PilN